VLALGTAAVAVAATFLLGAQAADADAYGGARHVGLALAAAELGVRYPLTVVAEETFFRGWMQPRLGRHGPVIAAVLWAGSHLQQANTIPSLVVVGLFLGLVRWWRGDVRVSGVLHYVSDAAFFVLTYL
jgi:membrane protease YdiL (CAAX protease family)